MAGITMLNNSKDAVHYPEGAVIFNQGDAPDYMYVILDGAIDIVVHGDVIDTARMGESFGEMALIDNAARSATAVARVDTRVVPINKRDFLWMVQETPMFALQVMGVMAERMRRHNDRSAG